MTEQSRDNSIAWTPSEEVIARAQLTRFLRFCGLDTFAQLQQRSTTDVAWFTEQLIRFLGIRFDKPYSQIVDLSRGIEWPRWCVGGQLNITKSCLNVWAEDDVMAHQLAVIWEGEEGETRTLSYQELADEVSLCAAGLRACGLKKGDAVGLHLPMTPETATDLLIKSVTRLTLLVTPIIAAVLVATIASNFAQGGITFTPEALKPNGNRFNPIKNLKNAVGVNGAVQFVKGVLVIVVLAAACYGTVKQALYNAPALVGAPAPHIMMTVGDLLYRLGLRAGTIVLVVAVLDYAWGWYQHEKSLKMTKQEVKDEYKDSEGKPEVKGRIR